MILRRFRPAGNGLLFDNSFNYEGLRLDSRMEKGYEEGCTWGVLSPSAARFCDFTQSRPQNAFTVLCRYVPFWHLLVQAGAGFNVLTATTLWRVQTINLLAPRRSVERLIEPTFAAVVGYCIATRSILFLRSSRFAMDIYDIVSYMYGNLSYL